MGSFVGYQCSICGKNLSADYKGYVCDSCGGNLNVILDYDHIKKTVKPEDIFASPEKSLWRYLPLLPVEDPGFENTTLHTAGYTPVLKSEKMAKKVEEQKFGRPTVHELDLIIEPVITEKSMALLQSARGNGRGQSMEIHYLRTQNRSPSQDRAAAGVWRSGDPG